MAEIDGHVHFITRSCFLPTGSPYFKSMFSSGMMEQHGSRLELPDIEKETFAAFKEYIYTGNKNITQDNVVQLLQAAAIFQVEFSPYQTLHSYTIT